MPPTGNRSHTAWTDPPYQEAAEVLAGDLDRGAASPAASRFLDLLGYDPASFSPAEIGNRTALLRFAARMDVLMPYRGPDAPGLLFFLGMFAPASFAEGVSDQERVSTTGADPWPGPAFEAAVGEAVEYASQFDRGIGQPTIRGYDAMGSVTAIEESGLAAMLGLGDPHALAALDWLPAWRLRDGAMTAVPADLCFRRPPAHGRPRAAAPLSIGCAAAPTLDDAVLSGLLELVERDAAALWWRGGEPAAGLALEGTALRDVVKFLQEIRRGVDARSTWLLDITSDLGIPCIAALSMDRDGRKLACGLAAGLSLDRAARGALREMGQYELAYHLIDAKRRADPAYVPNPLEQEQLQRGAGVRANDQPLLHPMRAPRPRADATRMESAEAISWIASRLDAIGLTAHAVDLTQADFAVPVAKVIVPGLPLDPSEAVTPRLLQHLRANGLPDSHLSRPPLH